MKSEVKRLLHIPANVAISIRMERKRYVDGRVIGFPAGSNWREPWNELRVIALQRGVTLGAVVLEALQDYSRQHKQAPTGRQLGKRRK